MVNKRCWKKYLLWFAQENVEFRIAEIESLISLFKIEMRYKQKPENKEPFWIVEFESDNEAKKLANRSVTLRMCMELWSTEVSLVNLHSHLRSQCHLHAHHFKPRKSFKITVETFGRRFTQREKVTKLESFTYLPIEGAVNLTEPELELTYIEYYGVRAHAPPLEPIFVFFGRVVAASIRNLIEKLSLKTRKFIGNTSMDPQLSLLMSNQARVRAGDVIFDPFVGSGSLLVAAAHFGAYVIGSDIDYLMLHGRTKPTRIRTSARAHDESVRTNLRQYRLDHLYLDVIVKDFSTAFIHPRWRFDAIITDPPYGLRESTVKVGSVEQCCQVSAEHLSSHLPAKVPYQIPQMYDDLLRFGAQHLCASGRLVCWLPVLRADYAAHAALPHHPCFKLVANSEQILNSMTSRRLLTYEKIGEPSGNFNATLPTTSSREIPDFREKYFQIRAETRRAKREKETELRRINYEKFKNKQ